MTIHVMHLLNLILFNITIIELLHVSGTLSSAKSVFVNNSLSTAFWRYSSTLHQYLIYRMIQNVLS